MEAAPAGLSVSGPKGHPNGQDDEATTTMPAQRAAIWAIAG